MESLHEHGLGTVCPLCRQSYPDLKEEMSRQSRLRDVQAKNVKDEQQRRKLEEESNKLVATLGTCLSDPGCPLSFELADADGPDPEPWQSGGIGGLAGDNMVTPIEIDSLQKLLAGTYPYQKKTDIEDTHWVSLQAIEATAKANSAHSLVPIDATQAREMAQEALQMFPHCVEAHNVLARCSLSYQMALDHYQRGHAAACLCIGGSAEQLQQILKEDKDISWSQLSLRAFIRASIGMANTLRKLGRYKESLQAYLQLHSFDQEWPVSILASSHFAWRAHLPEVFLSLGDLQGCSDFMFKDFFCQKYADKLFTYSSCTVHWNLASLLLRFLQASEAGVDPPDFQKLFNEEASSHTYKQGQGAMPLGTLGAANLATHPPTHTQ
jgi:tetratricopeptide (TPR) repeat protein